MAWVWHRIRDTLRAAPRVTKVRGLAIISCTVTLLCLLWRTNPKSDQQRGCALEVAASNRVKRHHISTHVSSQHIWQNMRPCKSSDAKFANLADGYDISHHYAQHSLHSCA